MTTNHKMSALPPVDCEQCGLARICFPSAMQPHEVRHFSRIVQRGRVIEPRGHLCRTGESLDGIYVVRSGALKIVHLSPDGTEAVIGFGLPGEVIGLEAIASGLHANDVVALERTTVCTLPRRELEGLSVHVTGVRQELMRLMSRALDETQHRMRLLAHHDARALVAGFVLEVANRLERRGFSIVRIPLSMRWRDVASYLGLTFETVSRALASLRASGALHTHARRLTISDQEMLVKLAQER